MSPCPPRCPKDDYWRSLRDEYSVRRSPRPARVPQKAAWRRPPIRPGAREPGNPGTNTALGVIAARRKTPVCSHQRRRLIFPGTNVETALRAPARTATLDQQHGAFDSDEGAQVIEPVGKRTAT